MMTVLSTKSALYLFQGATLFANPARLPEYTNWCGTKSDEVLSLAHRSSDGEQECVRNLHCIAISCLWIEELFVQVGTQASGHALTFAKLMLFLLWRV
jgi:hypothetical protein